MTFQAVIFDMDGLLMDSERVGLEVLHGCGKHQGFGIPLAMIRETLGSNKESASDYYHGVFPALDTDRLFQDFKDAMCALALEGKIPLKKGAKELLAALKEKGIPCAVASSSGPSTIRTYLASAGIIACFSALVSGAGLPSKPAPDVFLRAAEALGVQAHGCLVLEDSVNGVRAGRAAGMTVCMVPDMLPYSDALAPFCDYVMPDLAAVIPLLRP